MLAPDQRPERVLRRLRLHAGNVIQADAACEVGNMPRRQPKPERLQRIREIADRAGVSPDDAVKPASNREIVRAAGQYIAGNADHAEFVWRACSGAAHGDTWAMLSLHDREEVGRTDNVVTARTTASTYGVTTVIVEAIAVIKTGFHLHDLRNTPPY